MKRECVYKGCSFPEGGCIGECQKALRQIREGVPTPAAEGYAGPPMTLDEIAAAERPSHIEGVKFDTGKPRYDLIPPEALDGLAKVLTFGAQKYADRNWEKGMEWGRVFGALQRHMWAWWQGQHTDPETGLSHLHHAACCIAFLQTYEARGTGKDDRYVVEPGEAA